MSLDELIKGLLALQEQGHGSKTVLGCDDNNGAYGILGSPYVSDHYGDMGPFDLPEGTPYVVMNVG